MTALIRIAMRVGIARILATPLGVGLYKLLEPLGIDAERLADYATILVLGLGVAIAKALKTHPAGARIIEWVNLIISWGQTAAGPKYEPKHTA